MTSLTLRLLQDRIARFEGEQKHDAAQRDRQWLVLIDNLESAQTAAQAVEASCKPFVRLIENSPVDRLYKHGGFVEHLVAVSVNQASDPKIFNQVAAQQSATLVSFASARFALPDVIAKVAKAHDHLLAAILAFKSRSESERYTPGEARELEQTAFFQLKDLRALWETLNPLAAPYGVDWAVGAIQREALALQKAVTETNWSQVVSQSIAVRSGQSPKVKPPSVRLQNLHLVQVPESFSLGLALHALCGEVSWRLAELGESFSTLKNDRGRVDLKRLSDSVLSAQFDFDKVQKAGLAYDKAICAYHGESLTVHYLCEALRPYVAGLVSTLTPALEEAYKNKSDDRNRALNNCLYAEMLLNTAAGLYCEIHEYRSGDNLFLEHGVYASARRYHELNGMIRDGKLTPLGA